MASECNRSKLGVRYGSVDFKVALDVDAHQHTEMLSHLSTVPVFYSARFTILFCLIIQRLNALQKFEKLHVREITCQTTQRPAVC